MVVLGVRRHQDAFVGPTSPRSEPLKDRTTPDDELTKLILQSAIAAGETLARSESREKALPQVLAALGETTGVSRAYI